jgi:putative spermidine/putrescine transport system substrate-binding protein
MKRAIGLCLTVLLAAGCSGSKGSPDAGAAPDSGGGIGPGEGTLNIIAWAGYVENGSDDPNYDWVSDFQAKTGCMVHVTVASTSDEMVQLMNQGGFDLVTASGDASLTLVYSDRVRELDLSLIPAYSTIDPRLQSAPWHTVAGKHYGVPYQWGTNVLLYDKRYFATPPTSWSVLFQQTNLIDPFTADGGLPDGGQLTNQGLIEAYTGPIYVADAALYLKATQPSLGITDPYELSQAQFNAAIAVLRQQHALVAPFDGYWSGDTAGYTQQIQDFADGGIVAASSWPYQVNTLKASGAPVESVVPVEGATGWADTTMMHHDAPHPNCAYLWLNHSIEPKLQGDVAAWFGSVPVVPAACDGNALLGPEGCATNGQANFDQVSFWKTPIADCGNGVQSCIPYSEWVNQYRAVKGGQ